MLAQVFGRFVRDEQGATAMEYALLAGLIGIALVASFAVLGNTVTDMFGAGGAGNVINASAQSIN